METEFSPADRAAIEAPASHSRRSSASSPSSGTRCPAAPHAPGDGGRRGPASPRTANTRSSSISRTRPRAPAGSRNSFRRPAPRAACSRFSSPAAPRVRRKEILRGRGRVRVRSRRRPRPSRGDAQGPPAFPPVPRRAAHGFRRAPRRGRGHRARRVGSLPRPPRGLTRASLRVRGEPREGPATPRARDGSAVRRLVLRAVALDGHDCRRPGRRPFRTRQAPPSSGRAATARSSETSRAWPAAGATSSS